MMKTRMPAGTTVTQHTNLSLESLAVREIEDRRVLSVKRVNQGAEGYIFIDHYKMYLNVFLVRTNTEHCSTKILYVL